MSLKYYMRKVIIKVEVFESVLELSAKFGINIAEKSAIIWNIAAIIQNQVFH